MNNELRNIIINMSNKVNYLFNREKNREAKQKKRQEIEITSSKEIEEVFNFYRLYIKKDARVSPQSREAIRVFLKVFGKETLLAVMEKKSKSKWFQDNCAWRGASWFFSNKSRFNRWIEEGVPTQKKRPYFQNQPMTHDTKSVLVEGEWKQFVGDPNKIEWRDV